MSIPQATQQIILFKVNERGEAVLTLEGLKYFDAIKALVDSNESRLTAGGL